MSEATDDLPKIWLISWMYHDRSGGGFIRAFDNEQTARDLLNLLLKHTGSDRDYNIDAVECCREYD